MDFHNEKKKETKHKDKDKQNKQIYFMYNLFQKEINDQSPIIHHLYFTNLFKKKDVKYID